VAIESVNPSTGERLATFPAMQPAEVARVLELAARQQREWARASFAERAAPMRRIGALLRERAPALARLMAIEMGKPVRSGLAELAKSALVCEHFAACAEQYLAPRAEPSEAGRSYVRFDPLGVILAIMPWNFPYYQVFRFAAPHLMAGNGAVLKHASNVPQCTLSIEELFREAGFPRDLLRALLVEPGEVAPLIADERIAAVTITGGEKAGRCVAEAAGRALKPAVLELGGSDAFIVLADADLAEAARVGAESRTRNAGQACVNAKRFIVETRVHDAFVRELTAAMKAVRAGDPLDPASDIGPLAHRRVRDELHRQVREAIAQGASPALGCAIPPGPGAFYPPSVLVGVTPDNVAAREELFGPVAAVMRADGPDEAVALANASRFGLGAALWTHDAPTIERLVPRIEAGTVVVNGLVRSDPRLPFGGIKCSGYGRDLGVEGIRAFVNVKSVSIR
jgi:succinate-semialdehyde dehydrogenase / glutarate-semialdehyde dehydrogenase